MSQKKHGYNFDLTEIILFFIHVYCNIKVIYADLGDCYIHFF
jgi:hypothetical protein